MLRDNEDARQRILREQQGKMESENQAKAHKWREFRKDYKALETKLDTLADRVTHKDVAVPLGKKVITKNTMIVHQKENWGTDMVCCRDS